MTTTEAKTEPKTAAKKFEPVTFWLANPNMRLKIRIPGTFDYIQYSNGKAVAKTQEEYDLLVADGQGFEEDGFKPKKPVESTGYAPRSSEAYQEHLNKFIPQG